MATRPREYSLQYSSGLALSGQACREVLNREDGTCFSKILEHRVSRVVTWTFVRVSEGETRV